MPSCAPGSPHTDEPNGPLTGRTVEFGGCHVHHANRSDRPCTCDDVELRGRAGAGGAEVQKAPGTARAPGCASRGLCCCQTIDYVSHQYQGQSAVGGLLCIIIILLVIAVFALQAYQFTSTPDIVLSDSVGEEPGDHLALLAGCRYKAPAPIICVLVSHNGQVTPLDTAVPGAGKEGAGVFARYVPVRARESTREPVISVLAIFNPAYMLVATSLPPGDGNPPIPAYVVGLNLRSRSDDYATIIPYTETEMESMKPFSPVMTMLPERNHRDATVSLRRYTERVNTDISFFEDVSKASDDGTSDVDITETTWGYVPATVFGPINCTTIIHDIAAGIAVAAMPAAQQALPAVVAAATNATSEKLRSAGITECSALHYIVVGDRLKSTTLPSRTWWEIIGACAGLWACLYAAAGGARTMHHQFRSVGASSLDV
jgi:hypothetical protein